MSALRCSIVLCAGLVAETLPATVPAEAGPLNLVSNGDFGTYTNSNGSTVTGLGFQPGYNGTITGWTNNGNNGGVGYNFLFESNTGTTGPASVGVAGNAGNLTLWDKANSAGANSWNGQGPTATTSFMAMDGDYNTGAISQTISGLTKGSVYEVTFEYAFAQQYSFNGSTVQNLQVSLGSHSSSVGSYTLTSNGFSGWMTGTLYLQADGTSDLLSFLAIGNVQLPPFALFTDVAMYADPEPATVGMLAVGMAGVIGAARRRRARAQVAG